MGDVGSFPGFNEGSVRAVQFQRSAGQFLAGFGIHLGNVDYCLIVGDGVQLHLSSVHLHGNRLIHGEIARQSGQLHHLEGAVGSFEAERPVGIRLCGSNGIFSGEFGGFCREQAESDALQGSLLRSSLVTGDFASQQCVVELHGRRLVCGDFHCLACRNLIASC